MKSHLCCYVFRSKLYLHLLYSHNSSTCTGIYDPVLYKRNMRVRYAFVPGSRVQVGVLEAPPGATETLVIVDAG